MKQKINPWFLAGFVVAVWAASPVAAVAQATSYDDMPSYKYDPKSDPSKTAYKTPVAHDAPKSSTNIANGNLSLGTISSVETGFEISNYRYQEHDVAGSEFMHLVGPNFGLTLDAAKAYGDGWFFSGGLRLAYGPHNYKGGDVDLDTNVVTPSTHDGESDILFDVRALGGHDFLFNGVMWGLFDADLSPYAGLGFRYLDNDGTGTDSNGVSGYERYSHYIYLPVGVTPRIRLSEASRFSMNMEYDQLIYGWQVSELSDLGYGDITNNQYGGFGFRGNIMYERRSWSVGPFFEYWNINQSDTQCTTGLCGAEPHNQTIEYGLQMKYRFLGF